MLDAARCDRAAFQQPCHRVSRLLQDDLGYSLVGRNIVEELEEVGMSWRGANSQT